MLTSVVQVDNRRRSASQRSTAAIASLGVLALSSEDVICWYSASTSSYTGTGSEYSSKLGLTLFALSQRNSVYRFSRAVGRTILSFRERSGLDGQDCPSYFKTAPLPGF